MPLSPAALALLKAQAKVREGDFVFAGGRRGRGLSNMAMAALPEAHEARRHNGSWLPVDLQEWCSEQTNYPNEMSEMALAHAVGDKVEAAYRRGDLLEKRVQLMKEWARYLSAQNLARKNVSSFA